MAETLAEKVASKIASKAAPNSSEFLAGRQGGGFGDESKQQIFRSALSFLFRSGALL